MESALASLPDHDQLAMLRRLAKIYAFSFDFEQPIVSDIGFIDACMMYWTLCEIERLDDLKSISPRIGIVFHSYDNLYGSNSGYLADYLLDLSGCPPIEGFAGWLSGISELCQGSLSAALPIQTGMSDWIGGGGDMDHWRRRLIEDGVESKLTLYTSAFRSDLTIEEVAPAWPVPPTILGICAYFEALLYYHSHSFPGEGETSAWRAVPIDLRFDDILSWLNIQRPRGLVNETLDWRTETIQHARQGSVP